jgi:hypothetical protein
MAIASFPLSKIFSAISLNFNSIHSNHRIRTNKSTVRTTDASVTHHLGIMITLAIDLTRKHNTLSRAISNTDSATLALLHIHLNSSFKCHILKTIKVGVKKNPT